MTTNDVTPPVTPGDIDVHAWVADDGAVVVQIDTVPNTDIHENIRIWINDAKVCG